MYNFLPQVLFSLEPQKVSKEGCKNLFQIMSNLVSSIYNVARCYLKYVAFGFYSCIALIYVGTYKIYSSLQNAIFCMINLADPPLA